MRLKTILKILVVLVVTVVVALAVILLTVDVNRFKDQITAQVQNATGRELTIGGDIDLRLGLTTSLAVEDVAFANAEWGAEPDMLRVDQFAAEVSLLPLISGDIRVNRLILTGAEILLETDAQGNGNWELGGPSAEAAEVDEGDTDGDARIPVVQDVVVEDARLVYRDGVTGETTTFALERVSVRGEGFDEPLRLDVKGRWNEVGFAADGEIGAPAILASGGRPFPLSVSAQALGMSLLVEGSIADPQAVEGIDLNVSVRGQNLSGLSVLGIEGLPKVEPVSLAVNVTGAPDRVSLADIDIAFGQTDLSGIVDVDLTGARPRVEGALSSNRIDLTELVPADAPGTTTTGQPETAPSDRVFPDDPLPLEGLKAADVSLDVRVVELVTPTLGLSDVLVSLSLMDGVLSIAPFGSTVVGSMVTGGLTLDASADVPALDLSLNSPELDLGRLVLDTTSLDIVRGAAALDVALTGSGRSVAAIMGSLDGHARVLMEKGQAKTESFDLLVGGLSSAMGAVFGKDREWTILNCLATDIKFENGVGNTFLLADTEQASVTGTGTVRLAEEALDLIITPASKSATISIAVPVKVGGTLAKPSFRPDEVASARKVGGLVGGLLGSALFPPAALAALGEMGSDDNPCLQLASGEAQPEAPQAQPTDEPASAVEDVIEDVGDKIRGLFRR
ncbi:MAG: AsmA family protein [Alphaproteobacteria bacterium]